MPFCANDSDNDAEHKYQRLRRTSAPTVDWQNGKYKNTTSYRRLYFIVFSFWQLFDFCEPPMNDVASVWSLILIIIRIIIRERQLTKTE